MLSPISRRMYLAGHQHQQMQREMQMERQMQFRPDPPFGREYQNRNLMPVDRNNYKTFTPQIESCGKMQAKIIIHNNI